MISQILHVQLSHEAAARRNGDRNANGKTLRDWVLEAFSHNVEPCLARASLFSSSIEVEPDVPLLIEAYARIVACSSEDVVESWLMEPKSEAAEKTTTALESCFSAHLTTEALGNIAQALDMGETLIELFAADARRKLGRYPEGDKAAETMTEIFRALRINVGLVDSAEHE
jgi:hypothetical protein